MSACFWCESRLHSRADHEQVACAPADTRMDTRMDYHPVTRHVAACRVEGCTWKQEHILEDDARRDGERHLAEWHATPELPEHPKVVDLMEALEASFAAVKERRS